MEGIRETQPSESVPRHFREQADVSDEAPVEIGIRTEAPLEVNMTDEPGGDPYNHTGSFKRMFR